jgi:photosystem II stability/assembly factor-like uncharacterized protein
VEQNALSDAADGRIRYDASAGGVVYAGLWDYRRTGWSTTSGGPNGGLYRSRDFGATWQRLSGHGLPAGETGRIAIAIAPSDPQRVYALIESKKGLLWRSDDGGTTWTMVSRNTLIDERPFYYTHVFVDPTNENHLWALSVDAAVSSDGGPSFSFDDGKTWAMPHNLPIAQLYHVGYDRDVPYHICAPLQDNGVWCAPENGLSGRGISASQWRNMGGGDGTWVWPDPLDSKTVWYSSGGGNVQGELSRIDLRSGAVTVVQPYMRDQNAVAPKALRYRFNWETPFAFDPFNPHRVLAGGNVLFATSDAGMSWTPISGDLTRNDRAHQNVTGGITLDVTGAETSDTILYIEPSTLRRGEIWIGTDDGLVQLSMDGGTHWRDVTPALSGISRYGRFASLSASDRDPGTLYAVYDTHMVGDNAPHIFMTKDYGAHWRDLAAGLPQDVPAMSVRVDPRNPRLIYAGTMNGLWLSFDGGMQWQRFESNLPPVEVKDIRVQPDSDDLILATHGRGVYVLDDLTPLQQFAGGDRVFPVRGAIEWESHGYYGTRVDGSSAPYGAIVTYNLQKAARNVTAEIVDARGRLVRRLAGKDAGGGRAGLNRFTWDLSESPPLPWRFTPEWNRTGFGSPVAVRVVPGSYRLAIRAGAQTLRGMIRVGQDPRTHFTALQLQAGHDSLASLASDLGLVDGALNVLSDVLDKAPESDAALRAEAAALRSTITANPANDQDDDFLQDMLRERLQMEIDYQSSSFGPPTQGQRTQSAELHALTAERLSAVRRFESRNAARLRAIGVSLPAPSKKP